MKTFVVSMSKWPGLLSRWAVLFTFVFTARAGDPPVQSRINALVARGICGSMLQNILKTRAEGLISWNRPYQGDGVKDCYGYCRQVWNAILLDGRAHVSDFTNYDVGKARSWEGLKGGIPVNTWPDSNWVTIASLGGVTNLACGDLLGIVQGHRWGMDVHYGIAAGGGMDWDCHGGYGAEYRSFYEGFIYCYKPLHVALTASTPLRSQTNALGSVGGCSIRERHCHVTR